MIPRKALDRQAGQVRATTLRPASARTDPLSSAHSTSVCCRLGHPRTLAAESLLRVGVAHVTVWGCLKMILSRCNATLVLDRPQVVPALLSPAGLFDVVVTKPGEIGPVDVWLEHVEVRV